MAEGEEDLVVLRAHVAEAAARNARLNAELDRQLATKRSLAADVDRSVEEAKALRQLQLRAQRQQTPETEQELTKALRERLSALRGEHERLRQQADREEEFIATNLRQRLQRLKQEKIDCENRLEQEQEHIVNDLQKQLLQLSQKKNELQRTLHACRSQLLRRLGEEVTEARETLPGGEDEARIEALHGEINRLQTDHASQESAARVHHAQCDRLHRVLERLRTASLMHEKEYRQLRQQLDKVRVERKELFVAAEQLLEKRINDQLRSHRRRTGRVRRTFSDFSTDAESQGSLSSMCSSSVGTPRMPPCVMRGAGPPLHLPPSVPSHSVRSHSVASVASIPGADSHPRGGAVGGVAEARPQHPCGLRRSRTGSSAAEGIQRLQSLVMLGASPLVSPLPSPQHRAAVPARPLQPAFVGSTSAASLSPCPSQSSATLCTPAPSGAMSPAGQVPPPAAAPVAPPALLQPHTPGRGAPPPVAAAARPRAAAAE